MNEIEIYYYLDIFEMLIIKDIVLL